jgi:hypothetical protein
MGLPSPLIRASWSCNAARGTLLRGTLLRGYLTRILAVVICGSGSTWLWVGIIVLRNS